MNFKDHKLYIVSIGASIAVLVLIFLYSKTSKNPLANNEIEVAERQLEPDSDGDGLYDWQEELWNTDKNNPDTDGDGTPDGQEVRLNRDPNLAGPNDTYSQPITVTNVSSGGKYTYSFDKEAGATLTDRFAINVTRNYLEAKSAGLYNTELGKSIVAESISELGNSKIIEDIQLSQIKTVPNSNEAAKLYMNNVAKVAIVTKPYLGKELEVISQAISSNKPAILDVLSSYELAYKQALSELLLINVPLDLADNHLAFVRSYDTLIKSLKNIRLTLLVDPLSGYIYITQYIKALETLKNTTQKVSTYSLARGINFSTTDYVTLFLR